MPDAPGPQQIMTVLGPIAPEAIGNTLTHDHVLIDAFGLFGDSSYAWILDDEDVMARELDRFKSAGGSTIIDPTCMGLNRQPAGMRRLAQRTGLNLVMGTGWYRERCYPPYIREEMPDQLAERLVRDLVTGQDGTDVRAGFIGEIGTERHFITPAQERVFRAAGRAHQRTGCPVMTHTTHFGELAVEQLALLREEGVPSDRVVISHLGDRVGIHWWLPIAETGAYLNIDNLAFVGGYAPLEVRADNVAAFCAEGLVDQVMLSNDICLLDQLAQYGGPGYDNVITNFLPLLRSRGVTDEQIHTMTVVNPGRAFAYDAEGAARAAAGTSG
jgi:predicted metal-dependent phosphotriesterase family hydrolase